MRTNLIVVDEFYTNVDEVRNYALSMPFDVLGNYPGKRTAPAFSDDAKKVLSNLLRNHAGEIKHFGDKGNTPYSGSFQLCTAQQRTWIHADTHNNWAGVLYLTPDAPLSSGTTFYRHKKSQTRYCVEEEMYGDNAYDYTKWDVCDSVANVYNRLILFRSDQYHASLDYFGIDDNDSRLIQVFFLNTEY